MHMGESGGKLHISVDLDTKKQAKRKYQFSKGWKTVIFNTILTDIGNHWSTEPNPLRLSLPVMNLEKMT